MSNPLTPEKLEWIRADNASHDCSAVSNCHENVARLLSALDCVEQCLRDELGARDEETFMDFVRRLHSERGAYKFAAEQAAGIHMAENIGETLHALKQENRQLTEERAALRAEVAALLTIELREGFPPSKET